MAGVTRIGDGVFRVDVDGRSEIVYVTGPPGDRWAFWNGRTYRWTGAHRETEAGSGSRRRHIAARMEITAPMPAKIVAIKVREGETVKSGDTLVVLEAMKMELPVQSPSDGRVRAISCREGDLVPGDAILVELE
ncbi:MAG TPA: acetyl-CoA carboxylase biotin carboxyl carrier protein subunit [Vicinamibacterales bacterium]|nr:acetyl-CoA carboxylase biotin carboxyl carrier protein subunit [Vicinamibacterales bacterium]